MASVHSLRKANIKAALTTIESVSLPYKGSSKKKLVFSGIFPK